MEELIEIVNQLQDIFSGSGLAKFDLPQIVVVGAQSSGKSSVLEHLVGQSFLPRGTGIVTRCPLELRLVNSQEKANAGDYAIFEHKKSVIFRDYHEITKEIEDQTEQLAGGDKGICSTPICLKMYSKTFTNLTLVDLPGLTKVPVGDQPEDIEQQTSELILKHIRNPNSIILAVVPANADMATCESLKIAREVDPEGVRTLAVVTKLDLMDEGTDAKDMLSGRVIPVKLGIIGVVNRSQKGIWENKSMKQSLKDEKIFFRRYYKDIESFHGTTYLRKTIQTILINNIKEYLPQLKLKIGQKLQKQRSKLLNHENIETNSPTYLEDLILKFSNNFCALINGNFDSTDTKELEGGARIYEVFRSTGIILDSIDPLTGLSKEEFSKAREIALGICNNKATEEAFELLVKKQIKQLYNPCLKCVDLVFAEIIKIIYKCVNDPDLQLQRCPILHKEMSAIALQLLESCIYTTKAMVRHQVDIHLAFINYDVVNLFNFNDIDHGDVKFTRSTGIKHSASKFIKITIYFYYVQGAIKDTLPKIIMCFMVNPMMERLLSELMTTLSLGEKSDLFQESPEVLSKMNKIKKSILALEKADAVLNEMASPRRSSTIDSTQKITWGLQKNLNNLLITHNYDILVNRYLHFVLFFVCLVFSVIFYYSFN